jgi:hypothetical protein
VHPDIFRNAAQKDSFSRNEVNRFERKSDCLAVKSEKRWKPDKWPLDRTRRQNRLMLLRSVMHFPDLSIAEMDYRQEGDAAIRKGLPFENVRSALWLASRKTISLNMVLVALPSSKQLKNW